MLKLSVQNLGEATVMIKDEEGYSTFVMEVPKGTTKTRDITTDVLQRLSAKLKVLETPITQTVGGTTITITQIAWSVLISSAGDIRASNEGLQGLPSLVDFRGPGYDNAAGNTDAVCGGTALLGGQTKASLNISESTAVLNLEAVKPGTPGNLISAAVVIGSGSLGISVITNAITVTTAAAGNTVAEIAAAINAHSAAKLLVQAGVGTAGDITVEQDAQYLTGGVGPGVSLTCGNTACTITELTATSITFDMSAGLSAVGRVISLEYRNGPHISRLTIPTLALESIPTL
jgi:hypothetical protein